MNTKVITLPNHFVDEQRTDVTRLKAVPIVTRNAEEESEDGIPGAVTATEMIVIPLTLGGHTIDVGHRFGRECALVPRVDEDENDVRTL